MAAKAYDGRNLSFTVKSQEFNADGTQVTFEPEEAEEESVTFAELGAGRAAQWTINITGLADYGSGTFWSMLWEQAGNEISFTFKPYGNNTPSQQQPHFTGKCIPDLKPPLGGQAGETWTYETALRVTDGPTRKTA